VGGKPVIKKKEKNSLLMGFETVDLLGKLETRLHSFPGLSKGGRGLEGFERASLPKATHF
jgi:hypothetical protein